MRGLTAAADFLRRHKAQFVFSLALIVAGLAVLVARAQQGEGVPGIIVVRTADEAAQVLAALKAGADFQVVAKERSIDTTASEGGRMEGLSPANLRSELRNALKDVKAGQFTVSYLSRVNSRSSRSSPRTRRGRVHDKMACPSSHPLNAT